ncbi:hypothetical protein GFS31_07500 [Leptolyngbya sp. BL0902]|uniref:hypothetical protein n=1 Tax=Leptolyngbya sp. BL0902 TaxID=1115757 RepID=UPI0018E79B2F|nr:hypothetical protein [Leptolyngbya sp. BL0902]QQE64077.1 hypothetical protein GFS31_07500 [Leptolyngbya sp. BL0902]
MVSIAISINGVAIRLPDERWNHIIQRHADLDSAKQQLLETIATPTRIISGDQEALMALREIQPGKWLVVVYKEEENDGFVITAFSTRKVNSLNRRQQLWP